MPLRVLQLNSARKFVGEAAHALNLTQALRQAGHTVVLGLRGGFQTFENAEAQGLDPQSLNLASRWWPPKDLADMKRIARWVREQDLQVIHVHRGKEHWLAAGAVKLHKLRVPVIRTRHLTRPYKGHLANNWLAGRTARMIAVSRAVEDDIARTKQYEGRLLRIPGGIDLARFGAMPDRDAARTELSIDEQTPVVVCVARFAPVKAHDILLQAWQQVLRTHAGALLLLVGRGPLWEERQAQARELGIAERVRFLGKLDNAKVPPVLAAADAGVLASTGSEGFSRAVLEYMALRLPTAGTRVGAVPDLIEPGVNGTLAQPGDAADLARALGDLLALPHPTRLAWGEAARQKAERDHAYPVWAAAHEKVYTEVLDEFGGGR